MLAFKEIVELQKSYKRLVREKKLTKKAMCDLCIPFRDKYCLSDMQTLSIAREEMPLEKMVELFDADDHSSS